MIEWASAQVPPFFVTSLGRYVFCLVSQLEPFVVEPVPQVRIDAEGCCKQFGGWEPILGFF